MNAGDNVKPSGLRGLLQALSTEVGRLLRLVLGSTRTSKTAPLTTGANGETHNRRVSSDVEHPDAALSALDSGELIPAVHGSNPLFAAHDNTESPVKPQCLTLQQAYDHAGPGSDNLGQALQAPSEDVAALRRLLADVKAVRSKAAVPMRAQAPARPQERSLQATVQLLYSNKTRADRNRLPPLDPAVMKSPAPRGTPPDAAPARQQSHGQGSRQP
jgi:hypothetical protein